MASPIHAGRLYYPEVTRVDQVRRRLLFAGFSVAAVIALGIGGYWTLGAGRWPLIDCAYMVMITITTVGYSEVLPVDTVEYGRLFTMTLIASGMGVSVYFLSSMTAFIIEGDLREAIWRRRVRGKLHETEDHYIVCGAGETGSSVVEELVQTGRPVVVIERNGDHLDRLARRVGERFIALQGDATEDEILVESGLERARGIIATLHTDRDNLFVTVTARQMNPDARIVSRAVDERAGQKLLRAGAHAVVSPNQIGGMRMAHELLRPGVVGFMDLMVRHPDRNLTVHQCAVPAGSPLDGQTLAHSGIRQVSNALVLSVLHPDGETYTFNPPPTLVLRKDMVLFVLGDDHEVSQLQAYAQSR